MDESKVSLLSPTSSAHWRQAKKDASNRRGSLVCRPQLQPQRPRPAEQLGLRPWCSHGTLEKNVAVVVVVVDVLVFARCCCCLLFLLLLILSFI